MKGKREGGMGGGRREKGRRKGRKEKTRKQLRNIQLLFNQAALRIMMLTVYAYIYIRATVPD